MCSVEKSNVLEVSMLWKEVVTAVGKQYPDVELTHMCAPCWPLASASILGGAGCAIGSGLSVLATLAGTWTTPQCRSSGIQSLLTPL